MGIANTGAAGTGFLPASEDLKLLLDVAAAGSFSAAARQRDVAVSQLTRGIDRLEAGYQVRLVHRSRQGISVTAEGQALIAIARELLTRCDEFAESVKRGSNEAAGRVRIASSPAIVHGLLAPLLSPLLERHPHLRLELLTTDDFADLDAQAVDVAVRTGTGPDDSVVAFELGNFQRGLFASSVYLGANGTPDAPEALSRHVLVSTFAPGPFSHWPWRSADGQTHLLPLASRVVVQTSLQVQRLVECGVGIGLVSKPLAQAAVKAGHLVEVLADFNASPDVKLHAVTPPRSHRAPRVRAVIDFLQDATALPPLRSAP